MNKTGQKEVDTSTNQSFIWNSFGPTNSKFGHRGGGQNVFGHISHELAAVQPPNIEDPGLGSLSTDTNRAAVLRHGVPVVKRSVQETPNFKEILNKIPAKKQQKNVPLSKRKKN